MRTELPGAGPAQLLVDLSVLAEKDDKSGIQRVVRGVLQALFAQPPTGYLIAPIRDAGGYYVYAEQFLPGTAPVAQTMAGEEENASRPIGMRAGDIFIGLDLCPNHVPGNLERYADMRRHGVAVYFVVYDLLPVTHPEMFSAGAKPWFSRWLAAISACADGLLCISRAVADDLLDWIDTADVVRERPLQVGYFHLGADIQASSPSFGMTSEDRVLLEQVCARPSVLMVGTLEPRKMHTQALDAFEVLWRRGVQANLVIVGKSGWLTEDLARRLTLHGENGKRLFWLKHASDEVLLQLYERSAALLAASVAEGFGLPLIEAAQQRLPVMARDIPVFREVGGTHAYYFQAAHAGELATSIQDWLRLHEAGQAPSSVAMPWLTWAGSAQQLLDTILKQRWYRQASTIMG